MKQLLAIALTATCWGIYGPLLRRGNEEMGDDPWRALICVGLAYFLVAVAVPCLVLRRCCDWREYGLAGSLWSAAAGVAGAVGALGVILAISSGGHPIYIMPSVFGGAPVVGTIVAATLTGSGGGERRMMYGGVILVVIGIVAVLGFSPALQPQLPAHEFRGRLSAPQLPRVAGFTCLTILCWGIYGPMLHHGQASMRGSRLAAFVMVGLAYFLTAAVVPFISLALTCDEGAYTIRGLSWGLTGGLAGAVGALGVVLAFTFGGKPIVVMPLVFGGAPIVNTGISIMLTSDSQTPSYWFFIGLSAVVAGAVTVIASASEERAR